MYKYHRESYVFSIFLLIFIGLPLCLTTACGDDSGPVDAAVIGEPIGGTFSFSWKIQDGAEEGSCADVGGLTIFTRLSKQDSFRGEVDVFSCSDTQAQIKSRVLPVGTYDMSIDLLTSKSRSLLSQKLKVQGVSITSKQDTVLEKPFLFDVTKSGLIDFKVDGKSTAGNCESNADGGAGIVGVEFELQDLQGNCIPTTFVAEAGSQSAGSYTNDCSSGPTPMPCIGKDQNIHVVTKSGNYKLQIIAKKAGPINCYTRVSNFSVPGAALSTDLGELGLRLTYSLECDPNYSPPDAGPTPDASVDAGV